MPIPQAHRAIIAPEKLRDYLLNPLHERGGSKARLLLSLGYRRAEWAVLEADLREQHLPHDPVATGANPYGVSYEISAMIRTPSGRSVQFRSLADRFWLRCTAVDYNVPGLIRMAFDLFTDVILTRDVPESRLCRGDVGTVVERHLPVEAGQEEGYSVEFFDMTGRTITVITVGATALREPTAADLPAVRVRKTG